MTNQLRELEYTAAKASALIDALIFLQEGTNSTDRKSLESTITGLLHCVSDEIMEIMNTTGDMAKPKLEIVQ